MIQLYYNPTIFQTESINNGPPCPLCKGVKGQEEIKKTYCKVKWSSCGVSYRGYFSILFDKKKARSCIRKLQLAYFEFPLLEMVNATATKMKIA